MKFAYDSLHFVDDRLARTLWKHAPVIVASMLLVLMMIPAQTWHQPAVDAVYKGFDQNLIYVNPTGYGASSGLVQVSPESLRITTLPASQPTVTLLTSTLSFNASMNIIILQDRGDAIPLRIGIWSPRGDSGFFLNFGPSPWNFVATQTVLLGGPGMYLVGGIPVHNESLGQYYPNQLYHLEISVDKKAGNILSRLSTVEGPPTGTPMLKLVGGPSRAGYSDVFSDIIPVIGGENYTFGGVMRALPGSLSYKVAVQWLANNGTSLGFSGDWANARELQGWTWRPINATAPLTAVSARLLLGAGDNSTAFFADLYLVNSLNQSTNLLSNGDFKAGTAGWIQPIQLINPYLVSWTSSIAADQAPEILSSLRISLTLSSAATRGSADVVLQDYSLTLPHQIWQTAQIDDVWARALLAAFLLMGLLLVIANVLKWALRLNHWPAGSGSLSSYLNSVSEFFKSERKLLGVCVMLAVPFLIINTYLVGFGSHPFDMTSQEIWTYIAIRYNPVVLYQLPNTVTLARVWAGAPYHEAIFPYEPFMSYFFLGIGQLYALFRGAGGFMIESSQLEILIKAFNISFVLADSALVYAILRNMKISQNQALVGSALFLFNPAVLFSTSVWGATHVVSLFLLLGAIWLSEENRPFWAWLALALASLTRPQILIPAFMLGIVFLRKFRFRENLFSISWSVIMVFLLLAPFLVTTGPSLPRDVLANTFSVQEAGGNEPALTTVSIDAYSIWPLVTQVVIRQSGLSSIFYSSTSPLIGQFSYQQISQFLTLGVIFAAAVLLLFHRRLCSVPGDYLPLLALSTVGFLFLGTGLAATHYVLAIPLLIVSKRYLRDGVYYSSIVIWTLTTLVPMYGSLGFAILGVGYLAPSLSQSEITRLVMSLYSSDLFITAGVLANLSVFTLLAIETWLYLKGHPNSRYHARRRGVLKFRGTRVPSYPN